jgi:hypothetical protein
VRTSGRSRGALRLDEDVGEADARRRRRDRGAAEQRLAPATVELIPEDERDAGDADRDRAERLERERLVVAAGKWPNTSANAGVTAEGRRSVPTE